MSRPDSSLDSSEKERNAQLDHPNSDQSTTETKFDNNNHTDDNKKQDVEGRIPTSAASATVATAEHELYEPYDNGYHFPPAHTKSQSMKIGAKAFWNYTCTPLGFFVVLYGLNVVAWGGMLFLLLCNASPAMCYPTCNDINSPRRKWIEWDSQILNALFCVTGFGLAPWRFRDLYFLMQYRILKKPEALGRLAGIHRGWFRLPGSDQLPVHIGPENVTELANEHQVLHIPHPEKAIPNAPLTGVRAPPTAIWKMDFVIWFNVWNTFLQCVLSGFMWGMNRFDRPSWSTGLFVALACLAAAIGGLMMFFEGKKVKSIEGVPLSKEDEERLSKDKEMGVHHYNNIKDKKPKEKK
ncbi:hypothetical protein CSAL01_05560 [Colletotrichum salicis]|uniref:Alpha-L-rhamnosidase C n=1 Tax=Colletotrichum salicis TaxID=1209931 RepID=A0A135UF81_9PEZI|nr:hypothetical protein CSAL01_05560 [Colletotrichum salicis]